MNHKGSNGFGNGLFVGMVIGALVALLFTTKKGRKILRILSEEGLDKIKNWEGMLDGLDFEKMMEEEDDDEDIVEERPKQDKTYLATKKTEPEMARRVKTTTRRFFRGVPRR